MRNLSSDHWSNNHSSELPDFNYDQPICYGFVGAYLNQNQIVWYSNVYCIPILAIVGVLGNVLNAFVLARNTGRVPSGNYLLFLAICDTIFLIFATCEVTPITLDILSTNTAFNKWFTACVLYIRVIAATAFKSSVGLVVAFNLERYVSVCHPLYSHAFCNTKMSRRIIFGIIVSSLCLSIHWPITYERDQCYSFAINATFYFIRIAPEYHLQKYERVMNYLSMALFNMVPILLLCILNCLLLRTLHQVVRNEPPTVDEHGRRRSSQMSAHAILFAVVLLFLLCNGPQIPARILQEIYGPSNQLVMSYQAITQQLIFLNASMNFALYCLVSRRYRYLLWETVICCRCFQKLSRTLQNGFIQLPMNARQRPSQYEQTPSGTARVAEETDAILNPQSNKK